MIWKISPWSRQKTATAGELQERKAPRALYTLTSCGWPSSDLRAGSDFSGLGLLAGVLGAFLCHTTGCLEALYVLGGVPAVPAFTLRNAFVSLLGTEMRLMDSAPGNVWLERSFLWGQDVDFQKGFWPQSLYTSDAGCSWCTHVMTKDSSELRNHVLLSWCSSRGLA